MKMDPRVSLTWLLLLSATFLPDPGRAASESSQTDLEAQSQNSIWKNFEKWLKGLFKPKGEIATSAPEVATTTAKASEDTEESYISPTPLPGDSGTSAPETPSTAAEPSTDYIITDNFIISDPVTDSTELLTAPAPLSTLSEASSPPTPIFLCDSARTAPPKTTTTVRTTVPAEEITPEAEVLIGSTIIEKTDSGVEVITPSHAETDPAPDSQATPISLPQYLRMELLKFLTSLCGPRMPGMPSIQLQRCITLPTCRNYHSRDKRIIKFDFRGPIASRVCLHCNILACNRYNYPLQNYLGHRTREEASESVIIRIIPI